MEFAEEVKGLLNSILEKNNNLFLVDLWITEKHQVSIVLDGDEGVNLQHCVEVNKFINNNLDAEKYDFSIEVSSAGASSPLKLVRQYIKNIGRDLRIKTVENTIIEGTLIDANAEKIVVEWQSREPKKIGKGKETVNHHKELMYAEIKEAIVLISF